VRPGFITFTELLPFPGPPPIGETAQISIGPYSGHCAAGSCGGDLAPRLGHTYAILPFTLGEEYLFSGAFHAQAGVTTSTSIEFGNGGTIDFSYFLTDADGNVVAPFEIAVPEPTSVILCGFGACLLALLAKWRNRSSALQ
jgi:hypothetical protein